MFLKIRPLQISLFVILTCLFLSSVWAQSSSEGASIDDLHLSYVTETRRSEVSLGAEFCMLQSATASLSGMGPRFGFAYGLTDKWSLATTMTFLFEATGQPGSFFYSGIRGDFEYSFIGKSMKSTTSLNRMDGSSIYSSTPLANNRIAALAGAEQLFLNGTTSIYPAVGFTAGGIWEFPFMGHGAQIDLRYSTLTANDNAISMIGLGTSFNLDL